MIPIFFWWELPTFFNYAMPSVFCPVLVDLRCTHLVDIVSFCLGKGNRRVLYTGRSIMRIEPFGFGVTSCAVLQAGGLQVGSSSGAAPSLIGQLKASGTGEQ